jgi:hypothetical protein
MKKFFKIKNKCGMDLSQTEELFHDLGRFSQKRFGFKKPPTLHLVSDQKNASKPLGKTAYYDPQGMAVTLYTDNRHIKDILRSLAHELVHHMQNENGMLNDSGYHGQGYAQKNKNMREMERQAFEEGSLCMRDWEDGLKETKPTIYNEWRNKTMSTKKWKNNELMENVTRKFGFKMDLSQLNEASCGSKDKYEEELKEEKVCPECKGKGDECKCPDKKELKEKEKEVEMVHKDDVEPGDKVVVPDGRGPLVGIQKKDMNETKLRGIIRELILSEMKRK